jgi:UDP-N-acetylglucosamine--N-acetylmuramyl-(pentapeptide) pyrophosphoryl-undecaprenol N-acetylglucosamine transferase
VIIAFAGGGTGGHIVPALAIAEQLTQKGHQCIFIGNANSIEARLAKANAYPFGIIKVQKLYRSFSISNLLFPYHLARSIFVAKSILKRIGADAVFCTGGFVSGPVALAAHWLKIPLYFHESNSYPGLVTRFMARQIRQIYVAFETSRNYLPGAKIKNFGIPIKATEKGSFSLKQLGLDNSCPTIIVSGGSQGSLPINKVVDAAIPAILAKGYQIIWQTGNTTFARFAPKYADNKRVYTFAFSPELTKMLSVSQLAITRAGAMTIAELEDNRIPAILIPLPTAAENHQFFNAREQQQKGVAIMLEQSKLTPETLLDSIDEMAREMDKYIDTLKQIPLNKAATSIVEDMLSDLALNQGDHNAR